MYICKKICIECPFSNKSIKGWLADYTINDIISMQSQEQLFPCHMMMGDNDMSNDEVEQAIKSNNIKLCRGYVESMIKSCKSPRHNKILIDAIKIVKEEGMAEESLAIWNFSKHHTL